VLLLAVLPAAASTGTAGRAWVGGEIAINELIIAWSHVIEFFPRAFGTPAEYINLRVVPAETRGIDSGLSSRFGTLPAYPESVFHLFRLETIMGHLQRSRRNSAQSLTKTSVDQRLLPGLPGVLPRINMPLPQYVLPQQNEQHDSAVKCAREPSNLVRSLFFLLLGHSLGGRS